MGARREVTPAVHSSGEPVATKLRRIAEKARKEPGFKFTSLYHLMNEELLRGCFKRLRKDAAAGIDKMDQGSVCREPGSQPIKSGRAAAPDGVHTTTCPAKIHSKAGQHQATSLGDTMF